MKCLLCALAVGSVALDVNVPGLGSLRGQVGFPQGKDVAFFGGIPYAKPPIGALRWQPPVPYGPWESPRNAGWTDMGHQCVQGNEGAEDCLYLNVHTAAAALGKNTSLPAMIWIHGGSYTEGSGNLYAPFANELVVRPNEPSVVLVTINYRLNVFGFLASTEIKQRSQDKSAGNFGIQDQRLAMHWVKDHIGAFGGDGNAVTIFGESAGGNSVFNHLAQPASFKLYKNAIIESGAYNTGARLLTSAEEDYAAILNTTQCTNLDCLLKLDASTLEDNIMAITSKHPFIHGHSPLSHGHGWGPVIDGVSLTASPADLIQAGNYNKKATVIIGSNRDEDASPWFEGGELHANLTEAAFDAAYIAQKGSADLKKVKSLYTPEVYPYPKNLGKYSRWWWTATRVATDQVPGLGPCGVRWLARKLADGGSTVYTYLFARACQSFTFGFIPACKPGSVIAPHAGEIPYVFGDLSVTFPQEDRNLTREVSAHWRQFATLGKFESSDWPEFEKQSDVVKRFDVTGSGGSVTQQGLRKDACDYWESKAPPTDIIV